MIILLISVWARRLQARGTIRPSSLSLLVNCGFWRATPTVLSWKGQSYLWSAACWFSAVSELQTTKLKPKHTSITIFWGLLEVNGEWRKRMGSVFSEPWEKHVYRHSVDNVAHATIYCVTTFKGAVCKSFSCKYKSGLKMINRSWFWGYADVLF